ncbi:hypothetical protein, partial [Ferrimicrobium sp.]|uniref:hypothetical protein n=1 Tax=Ferrimicrobium sp. TaxID=2926050 RepID=UPI00261DA745
KANFSPGIAERQALAGAIPSADARSDADIEILCGIFRPTSRSIQRTTNGLNGAFVRPRATY